MGTRPDAIKLAPVILEIKKYPDKFKPIIILTAQHREMLDQVISLFDISVDYDLNIMKHNQNLFDITENALIKLREVIEKEKPDLILVQGDTTTAFIASLVAFYLKIPVAHIEAGLRTHNKYFPFPEEMNRKLISCLTDLHFAPTRSAKRNLLKEGISKDKIFVVGNTVVDALFFILNKQSKNEFQLPGKIHKLIENRDIYILLTAHRRENFGKPLKNICLAIREIAQENKDIKIIYPVHPNPNVSQTARKILKGLENVLLIAPVSYEIFVWLMKNAYLILTDSGGIQEEAPYLGKPVLVLRNESERGEAVKSGTVKVIGVNKNSIIKETQLLLDNTNKYKKMARFKSPYGDGKTASHIVNILKGFEKK